MRSRIFCSFTIALASTAAIADTQRPSAPNNVQAASLSSSANRVTWNTPWDDTGVDGYNIYRDGSYYSTVGATTNYVDYGVNSGRSYRYSVVAFDAARNYSVLSPDASVTTGSNGEQGGAPASGGRPASPSNVSAQASGNGIQVTWNAPGGSIAGYNLYRDNSYYTTVRDTTSYTDSNVDGGRSYSYRIVAFTTDSQFSPLSSSVTASSNGGATTATLQNDDSSASSNASGGYAPAGYTMVFNDEFRGGNVDPNKWSSRQRWGPDWVVNGEQQYYVDLLNEPNFGYNPFQFDGENLNITASRTPDHLWGSANSQSWLSGVLTTYGKFKMRYGYVEMRAQLPAGQGLWPAFWLLNQHDHENQPEIDVVEGVGRDPNTVYQVYHYYDNWNLQSTPSFPATGADFSAGMHTYGMKWEPGRITWYIDGRETNRFESGNVSWEEMYIIVNLAVGGYWNGSADSTTPSPSRLKVDYIRAYSPP